MFFTGLFFSSSLPLSLSCLRLGISIVEHIQSGSQLSVNQEALDPSLGVGLPDVQAVTAIPVPYNIGSVSTPIPSGYTTPSSTPLPLELHIDEDGCSVPTASASSTLVITSSKSLQYSRINQLEDSDLVGAEICPVESLGVSSTIKLSGQTEDNTPTNVSVTKVSSSKVLSPVESGSSPATVKGSPSPVPTAKSNGPVILSKSPSPINSSPTSTAKNQSLSDFNSSLVQSPSPNSKSSVPVSQSPERKTPSPVPRLSSPVPVPEVSVPKRSSPETAPMSASPVPIPRFPSPVPKIGSPVLLPNICSSLSVPKSSSPETLPKNAGPVVLPRLSSPVAVTANETLVRSPPVIRKTFTVAGTSSPRASPLPPAAVQSNSLSSSPSDKQGAEILDLKWPCRDPVLDDALDRLLSSDSARARENQTPASLIPGDEDASWEEEDGIYPDFSREGTLTPMTESSWMDECFTPSTCPGTPDAALDLPSQQPSAIERLSASGQVGRPT